MFHLFRLVTPLATAFAMAAMILPTSLAAQSYIELDTIDLEDDAPGDDLSAYGACLFGSEDDCDAQHESAVSLSLDDVVNCAATGEPSLENVCNIAVRRNENVAAAAESEGTPVAAPAQPLRSIDIEVFFDYDSDEIRADQFAPLLSLARDIRRVGMSDSALLVVGHTDAKGSAAYNYDLSKAPGAVRRTDAEAVCRSVRRRCRDDRSRFRPSALSR